MVLVCVDRYCESHEFCHFLLKQPYLFAFDNNLFPIRGVNSSIVVTLIFLLFPCITPSPLQNFTCLRIASYCFPRFSFDCFLASIMRSNSSFCLSGSSKTSFTFSNPSLLNHGAVLSAYIPVSR